MARKKKKAAEAPENEERWLLTYSDMITLLLALFIILYATSNVDAKKFAQIAQSMGETLGTSASVSGGGGGTGTGSGKGAGGTAGVGKGSGTTGVQVDALDQIYNILQAYVDQNHLQNQVGLVNTNTYVKIHLKDQLMFKPDSAIMLPNSDPVLQEIEDAIAKVYDQVDHVTFSGHTADVGPHTPSGDQVSWKLSTDRAVTVLNKMIGYGLGQDKVSIEGYAHFSPIANNNTEEGRAKNRRVEITIYKTPKNTKTTAASALPSSAPSASSKADQTIVIRSGSSGSTQSSSSESPASQTSSAQK